nr:MAG TPA: hypothetical protein [Caudoviricetes sp.]
MASGKEAEEAMKRPSELNFRRPFSKSLFVILFVILEI